MPSPEDPRAAFVAGAEWWAARAGQAIIPTAASEAERRFQGGRADRPTARPPTGNWPPQYAGRAFVDGAKWQEFEASGGTMWQSDQDLAEQEAERRYPLPLAQKYWRPVAVGSEWTRPSFPVPTVVTVEAMEGEVITARCGKLRSQMERAEFLALYRERRGPGLPDPAEEPRA